MSQANLISTEKASSWSPFLSRLLNKFPGLPEEMEHALEWPAGQLYDSVYNQACKAQDEQQLAHELRVLRNKMMGRIALRDLRNLASLQETINATSELADALVAAALDWHTPRFHERYGTPVGKESGQVQSLIVIGMGKLGGQELNFSSDIDLIFTFPEGGQTEGAKKSISNDQFFIRLGQAINKSLVETTMDGFVYRVDMRLRPFGDSGPLAVSFASLEHYYELHGRAWERYALVKARAIAGDATKASELFQILRPFVYRRYVDFTAMDSLRELKKMIAQQVAKKGMEENIKLGAGGIREIEFIVQAFQLVHGGRDRRLQLRALLPTLKILQTEDFLTAEVCQGLEQAYCFLRRIENRLQMWNDQQTHDLPKEEKQQQLLAESLGFETLEAFNSRLKAHRRFVQIQFEAVFAEEENSAAENLIAQFWHSDMSQLEALSGLEIDAELLQEVQKRLIDFKQGRQVQTLTKQGSERLDEAMPVILEAVLTPELNSEVFKRVLKVIESITKRSVYLVLLKENPHSLKHLMRLCESSAWLADLLVKYPALLDQLLDERQLYSPLKAADLKQEAMQLMQSTALDEEQFMDKLRQWRHAQVFKVAAADVTGQLPVMQVSDYLTWIAEAVLAAATEFAWQLMQAKSGVPGGLDEKALRNPFLILGYGKLGGIELGYGSDLDMVFLYSGVSSSAQTINATGRSLDNSIYFIRMGQKIISLLSTVMPTGRLYEVDTRLRPNGKSGMLVSGLQSYQKYIENKAWNWEHQALVRARAVTGDEQSIEAFEHFKSAFLQQPRERNLIRQEVVEMRQKMQQSLDKSNAEEFDLKQGAGGIVDIEFMMQYLVLSYAAKYPQLVQFTDNVRILEAVANIGLLPADEVEALTQAYKVYRSKYHRVALANDKPMVSQSCYQQERADVIAVWQQNMLD